MVNDLVSVVIPVYNRQDTIKRAIDSVLLQTYSNVEVIVVDDGSTDKTVSIVKEYDDCRIKLICQKERGGANKARNVGIASAKGEYIAFQDSDDEWLPDKLRSQIEEMQSHGYLACYTPYYLCEKDVSYPIPFRYADTDMYQTNLRKVLASYNVVGTPTLVIKRQVLDLVGRKCFDESIPKWQDYDFVIRLSKCVEIGYVCRPLVRAYRLEHSITADREALYQAVSQLIVKHKDFLDIISFLSRVIAEHGIMSDTEEVRAKGLEMIQGALADCAVDVKNLVIAYAAGQLKMQEDITQKQYDFCASKLVSGCFAIYGAGKIGQQIYQKLKAEGLYPKCFLVTKCAKPEYLDGIPVISVSAYTDRESPVIIGISREHQAELMVELMKRNYRTFCVYPC